MDGGDFGRRWCRLAKRRCRLDIGRRRCRLDFGDTPFGVWFNEVCTDLICYSAFRDLLEKSPRPDLVVSVHPLMQHTPMKA